MNTKAALCGFIAILAAAGCAPKTTGPLTELPVCNLTVDEPIVSKVTTEKVIATPAVEKPAVRTGKVPSQWVASGSRRWFYIVIHHSATDFGNAAIFDRVHRSRGMDELGYHFVIGNGSGGRDGVVEVGSRWKLQKWGAHCGKTPRNEYNNHGIGVCLVGDFCDRLPSKAQLASLNKLVVYLMRKYQIAPSNIIGHQEAPNAATACPGKALQHYIENTFRRELTAAAVSGY